VESTELIRVGKLRLSFVKPILEASAKGSPDPIGSSVLVSFGQKQFFRAAHHVIAEPPEFEKYRALYTFLPEQFQLSGQPALSALDPHDIALVEIPQAQRPSLLSAPTFRIGCS
jgi:hypothetical protein